MLQVRLEQKSAEIHTSKVPFLQMQHWKVKVVSPLASVRKMMVLSTNAVLLLLLSVLLGNLQLQRLDACDPPRRSPRRTGESTQAASGEPGSVCHLPVLQTFHKTAQK